MSGSTLIPKLAKIMANVKRMDKAERNPQGWTYTSVMDMVDAIRPEFAKAGIIMYPDAEKPEYVDGQSARGTATVTCRMAVRWVVTDGESEIAFHTLGEALDTSDKATGKAFTAAQKLAVSKLMMMTTGDEDADAHHVEAKPRPNAKPAPEDEGHGLCADHGIPWKRYTKGSGVWYSHPPLEAGGQWHRRDETDTVQPTEPKLGPPVNKWAQEFAALASKRFASQIEGVAWCREKLPELNDRSVKNWTEADYERLVVLLREPVAAREV